MPFSKRTYIFVFNTFLLFYCANPQTVPNYRSLLSLIPKTCFNDSLDANVTDYMFTSSATYNETTSSFTVLLRVTWNVSIAEGVELDGFLFLLRDTSSNPIFPLNACVHGKEHFWAYTNDSMCSNDTSLCEGPPLTGLTGRERLCPHDYFPDVEVQPFCKGTGSHFIKNDDYVSVPLHVRELTFPIDFYASYDLFVRTYHSQYVSGIKTVGFSLAGALAVQPVVDCLSLITDSMNIDVSEAEDICCAHVPNYLARNITVIDYTVDIQLQGINVTIRWLPPINSTDLDFFDVVAFVDFSLNVIQPLKEDTKLIPLTEEERNTLSNCDDNTHYYKTVIGNLKPTNTYNIVVKSRYHQTAGKDIQRCGQGLCDSELKLEVPELNICNTSLLSYCVDLANCSAADETGRTTFNSTCTCPSGYFGNGINVSTYNLGTGCRDLSYCDGDLNPCDQRAICSDRPAPLPGADCECSTLYFGDGFSCTSLLAVVLGTALPCVFLIAGIVMLIGRRYYKQREKKNDLLWSHFVANDALKTYTTMNNLAFDNEDEVLLPTFGEKWELDRSNLQLGSLLGRGNYGVVYQAMYESENEEGDMVELPVAVKTVKEGTNEDKHIAEFLAEIGFMLNVGDHPNVLNVIGCCTTKKPVYLITDLLKYGDLLHFLWDAREPTKCLEDPIYHLTEKSLYQIARQVVEGMDYLTKSRIIHGDIAARNILVGEQLSCKISDFGLANDVYRYGIIQGQSERCVPLKWVSPERMMAGKMPITSKSDVWSFGILLYEMVTLGCMPYADIPSDQLLDQLKSGHRMNKPSTCSNEMYSLMSKCWKWRPSSRPTFAALKTLINDAESVIKGRNHYVNLTDASQDFNKMDYEDEIDIAKKQHALEHQNYATENHYEKNHSFKEISPAVNVGYANLAFETSVAI